MIAFSTEASIAGWNSAPQGRTITRTPANPARIAIQRPASSFSPSTLALASAIMIGTEKKIEAVTVSCRYCSAQKLTPVMAMNISARSRCQRRWLVRTSEKPRRGNSTMPPKTACITKRSQTTTITGTLPTSHFALPSSSENERYAPETRPMPIRRLRALSAWSKTRLVVRDGKLAAVGVLEAPALGLEVVEQLEDEH